MNLFTRGIYISGIVSAMNAVNDICNEEGINLYIRYAVGHGDLYGKDIHFPIGYEQDAGGMKTMTMQTASCKSFEYDEESGDFVYDATFGGKPQFCNIQPISIVNAFMIDDNGEMEILFINAMPQIELIASDEEIETAIKSDDVIKPEFEEVKTDTKPVKKQSHLRVVK